MTRRAALAVFLIFAATAWAGEPRPGPVVAIGGGRLPDVLIDRIVTLARGRIVVCPAASGQVEGPEVDRFRARGATSVEVVDFRSRKEADDPERSARLENAGGIFFTGGEQERLLATLEGSRALEALRRAWKRGAAIAGTSAGCAALGELSILRDPDVAGVVTATVPVGAGLGFVPGAIVDQHFLARKRQGRLASALLRHPEKLGIGVDEGTAVVVQGRSCEVIGNSFVSVYAVMGERTFTLRLVSPGERFELAR